MARGELLKMRIDWLLKLKNVAEINATFDIQKNQIISNEIVSRIAFFLFALLNLGMKFRNDINLKSNNKHKHKQMWKKCKMWQKNECKYLPSNGKWWFFAVAFWHEKKWCAQTCRMSNTHTCNIETLERLHQMPI